ncbi:MAG: hypothetical protein H6698_08520 [Myxococcales bacterium]|nr:hypothetical protein [Myxococcales bacterium]MCB9530878.1 hypothetical protein [Myxococcales bacterium]MCB9534334.1 hypothetical protein [Myxococcales bacterium]
MKQHLLTALAASLALGACSKPEPIDRNETGTLADGDALFPADQSYMDEYPIEVGAGGTIVAEMRSDEFDTYLHIVGPGNDPHEQNDDISSDDTNSRVELTAPTRGTYRVIANALYSPSDCQAEGSGEPTCTFGGNYTLSIKVTYPEG